MRDKSFLIWLHQRLEHLHGESPNMDYMCKLRSIIEVLPKDQVTPNTCSKTIDELANEHYAQRPVNQA